jgi:hypothetical protein
MQFLLIDVGATLVFLVGYLAIVTLQGRRALAVAAGSGGAPRETGVSAPRDKEPRRNSPPPQPDCRREWPRLMAPR